MPADRGIAVGRAANENEGGVSITMLLPEAVIAELLGAVFVAYSCIKRIGGNEGYGAAVLVLAVVLLAGIPLTANFLS
jgi:hypothetical protein